MGKQVAASIVSSAAYVLTVVFGMGTGVSHKRIATSIFFVIASSAFRFFLSSGSFPDNSTAK